eukprot:603659-Rhodomonas_salina.1
MSPMPGSQTHSLTGSTPCSGYRDSGRNSHPGTRVCILEFTELGSYPGFPGLSTESDLSLKVSVSTSAISVRNRTAHLFSLRNSPPDRFSTVATRPDAMMPVQTLLSEGRISTPRCGSASGLLALQPQPAATEGL